MQFKLWLEAECIYRNISDTIRIKIFPINDNKGKLQNWDADVWTRDGNVTAFSEAGNYFDTKREAKSELEAEYGRLISMGNIPEVLHGWNIDEVSIPQDDELNKLFKELKSKGFDVEGFISDMSTQGFEWKDIINKLKAKHAMFYSQELYQGDPSLSGQMPDSLEMKRDKYLDH